VLSARRAAWLAARAARRRSDGSRGPLAWLAWRQLVRAGDQGRQDAISAVWAAWVRAPTGAAGGEFWEALSRWREPQGLAEDVFEAAADPERVPAERAAIGDFCRQHGLPSQDAIRRAMFWVLTGQAGQHGADDPDGRLLAVGYGLSAEPIRQALRSPLASVGDLDVVRVVGGHAGQLTAEERGYLSRHLVSHRDWAGLWHLARDLPLTEAVATMRLLRDGWEPGGESDRALFSQLAQADPEAIARSAGEFAARERPTPGSTSTTCRADRWWSAMTTRAGSRRPPSCIWAARSLSSATESRSCGSWSATPGVSRTSSTGTAPR
jgi:hypothetical protein